MTQVSNCAIWYKRSCPKNQPINETMYSKDSENPEMLNITSRMVLVYLAVLLVAPRRLFTVISKNEPYKVKKAAMRQSTICTDINIIGSNNETALVSFVTLLFSIFFLIVFISRWLIQKTWAKYTGKHQFKNFLISLSQDTRIAYTPPITWWTI